MDEGWQRAQRAADDDCLDSVALNLHGFYSGLERIFERIAAVVDGSKPTGENWHQALLEHMTAEVFGVRPAVISDATREQLDAYRGFRHVVRNVYTGLSHRRRYEVDTFDACLSPKDHPIYL